jgi:cell division protease FtsH
LVDQNQHPFLGQMPGMMKHSEKLEQIIDDEIQEIIRDCYETAKKLLVEKHEKLEKMAHVLMEREKIDENDIVVILGPRPQALETKQEEIQPESVAGTHASRDGASN